MSLSGGAATRSGLIRSRRRQARVRKGIDLLIRKRKALVADLFRIANPAIEARGRVLERAAAAYDALRGALPEHGVAALAALSVPTAPVEVEVSVTETWGVATGTIRRLTPIRRTLIGRGQAPGFTGPAVGKTAREFEQFAELLLEAASTEMLLRRLAEALARTSRQVNTLEQRVAPVLGREIRRVRAVLEEREREDLHRLKQLLRRRQEPGR
jgi:H(+)-transporting ATP synthase subunit D